MSFSYYDKDNNIKRLNIEVGKEWSSYKEKEENSLLNSVFDAVDQNSDGKVDKEELNILQKLLKVADSQIENLKNNNKIEQEELELIVNKIEEKELGELKGNEKPSIIIPKIINIPQDVDKLKNYTYIIARRYFGEKHNKVEEMAVDFSSLKILDSGNYYIEDFEFDESLNALSPRVRKMQESNQDGTTNWSEGINRNISKIQFDKSIKDSELLDFMKNVGQEQGFIIEILDGYEQWLEDMSIIRADKKQLIPNCDISFAMRMYDEEKNIYQKRKDITIQAQGSATQRDYNEEESHALKYSHEISQNDVIIGKTYLEGGNVLNTLTKNGEPAVVIGEESILYTILALDLDNSEESVSIAKKQIAHELGLKEENITYIPQFDFHIDMHYRPLNDGQIAIPDYEMGINVLREFIQDIDKKLELNTEKNDNLQAKKEEYNKLIAKLEDMKTKTAEISQDAENELKKQGYEIVRIPCFTEIDNGKDQRGASVENAINYMNGICGTSAKTGDKFYITNTSDDEALDAYMENYFKEVVGFDKVYFAPTKKYLESLGGIDCLTKEF